MRIREGFIQRQNREIKLFVRLLDFKNKLAGKSEGYC
jgi:hypothetical protein